MGYRIWGAFFSFLVLLISLNSSETYGLDVQTDSSTRRFYIPVTQGRSVQATLRLPRTQMAGRKIPVFLIFGGFESATKVLDLIHPKKPVALASFDYPFLESRDLKLPGSLRALPEAKRLFPTTVRGIVELVKILKNQPEIDARKIVAVGASFGAPFVLAAAAREPDISHLVLVHAFGQIPETAENVVLKSWLPRYGWTARPAAWLLSRLIWMYLRVDPPELEARKLKPGQRVLMITASKDSFIPASASDSLWNAIQQSPAHSIRKVMPTDHLMPGSEKLIDQMIHDVEIWIDDSLLFARALCCSYSV